MCCPMRMESKMSSLAKHFRVKSRSVKLRALSVSQAVASERSYVLGLLNFVLLMCKGKKVL